MKYLKHYNKLNEQEDPDLEDYENLYDECVEEIDKHFPEITISGYLPDIGYNDAFEVWEISKNGNISFFICDDEDETYRSKNTSFSIYRYLYKENNNEYIDPKYIMTYNLKNINNLIEHAFQIKNICSFEYQKKFLQKTPEKYKNLRYYGYADGIKDEFDWLFNASDMGLM